MKIGIQELLVVFIVALVVIGPEKLPYYAKKFGQALGQFRKYTEEATKDIRESVVEPLNEAQKPLREAMAPVTELEKDVRRNVDEMKKSISDIGKPAKAENTKSAEPVDTPQEDHPATEPQNSASSEAVASSSSSQPENEQV